jgi:hypothetical protein
LTLPTGIVPSLAYVGGLLAHRDAVALRVSRDLRIGQADQVEWSIPRPVCVTKAFGQKDESVACQLAGRLELVRVTGFGRMLWVVQRA